jgi:excisionase family DNA binding protein
MESIAMDFQPEVSMKELSRDVPARSAPGESSGSVGSSGEPARVHRRVEITVEREVISVLGTVDQSFPALCKECGREVTMLTPEGAAAAVGTTARTVYRWVEDKQLHFMESGSGKVFVCSESLHALQRAKQISSGESR